MLLDEIDKNNGITLLHFRLREVTVKNTDNKERRLQNSGLQINMTILCFHNFIKLMFSKIVNLN